jgi:hypothetical protein
MKTSRLLGSAVAILAVFGYGVAVLLALYPMLAEDIIWRLP